MTRTRPPVAAPQFTQEVQAGEVKQQNDINLNPGPSKGQEALDIAPAYSPKDIETAAFYEQIMSVMLMEDPNEGAGDGVVLNVNGEDCYLPTGRLVSVKRKFVHHLCEMRETKFTQPKRDQFHVEGGNRLVPRSVLLYPFTVQFDPHPHGGEWLRRNLQRTSQIAQGMVR